MATNDPRDGSGDGGGPGPESGGCLNFGWGCLPLLAAIMLLPAYLFH